MIYELRTYTVKQGSVPEVAKTASTVARDIRKDDYGKLEGYWVTEIGPLNQVMHLWSYKRPQRARAPARPSSPRTRAGTASTCRSSAPTSCARTSGCSMP